VPADAGEQVDELTRVVAIRRSRNVPGDGVLEDAN
jgi:hypothetical protein